MPLLRYLSQYRLGDMLELLRNEGREPLPCPVRLEGKTVVISGATSGIGLECARLFAGLGADLVLVNRDQAKSERLAEELKRDCGRAPHSIIADSASLESVRRGAGSLLALERPIDVLIHNAGTYCTRRILTADGNEMVFQVNHLAPFLITWVLKDRLKADGRARIIHVNSEGHRFALNGLRLDDLDWGRRPYGGLRGYGAAKTAQLLVMIKWKEFFEGSGVTINAMHPGNVRTSIGEANGAFYRLKKSIFILPMAKDPSVSARALHYLAASPDLDGLSGRFFNLTTLEKPAPHALDREAAEALWDKSLELCGLR
jgi:NAD(P)-dependent dehydrogenase (short-subunit alcohol dehydrogenase family)